MLDLEQNELDQSQTYGQPCDSKGVFLSLPMGHPNTSYGIDPEETTYTVTF